MDTALPTASVLYNYDTDRDASPGLVIAKGGSGPNESDPAKYQAWRTPAFSVATVVQGSVLVKLWSGTKDFDLTARGAVSVYLRDCAGSNCVQLGGSTLSDPAWQRGSTSWTLKTFTVSVGTHTVAPARSLELKVIVEGSSTDDMWFAYDTNNLKSRVEVPAP